MTLHLPLFIGKDPKIVARKVAAAAGILVVSNDVLIHRYTKYISTTTEFVESKNEIKIVIAPGPDEIKESSKINALCILDNGKALDISQLSGLIEDSLFVVANDTGPAHIAAHLGSKGIALFGSHTTPFKVSIERENFKAIQAPELSKLSAEKVFERMSVII